MSNVTNFEEAKRLLNQNRFLTFTLPTLQITIEYRKPDLVKLAMRKALPSFMADAVLKAYKAQLAGREVTEDNLPNFEDDNVVTEIHEKGYTLLSELTTSLIIKDVPNSDLDNGLLAFIDIPEVDAMAFLIHLIQEARTQGGEVSYEETIDFPDGEQSGKRSSSRKNGKDVRAVAE